MRFPARFYSLSSLLILSTSLALAQSPRAADKPQSPRRDPQGLSILQASAQAMGGGAPNDSIATGTAVILAGGDSENGLIRSATRNVDQSSEELTTAKGTRRLVYSRDLASDSLMTTPIPMEMTVISQSPNFPLPLLLNILSKPGSSYEYLGRDACGNKICDRVRTWNSFSANPDLASLAEFTVREFWIDISTKLPVSLRFAVRAAPDNDTRIPTEVFYEDYRTVNGFLYPFSVHKNYNGTPFMLITFERVVLNSGVPESDFAVPAGDEQ
jgi:hypothetical protein